MVLALPTNDDFSTLYFKALPERLAAHRAVQQHFKTPTSIRSRLPLHIKSSYLTLLLQKQRWNPRPHIRIYAHFFCTGLSHYAMIKLIKLLYGDMFFSLSAPGAHYLPLRTRKPLGASYATKTENFFMWDRLSYRTDFTKLWRLATSIPEIFDDTGKPLHCQMRPNYVRIESGSVWWDTKSLLHKHVQEKRSFKF